MTLKAAMPSAQNWERVSWRPPFSGMVMSARFDEHCICTGGFRAD
jgi:hypothetical protein